MGKEGFERMTITFKPAVAAYSRQERMTTEKKQPGFGNLISSSNRVMAGNDHFVRRAPAASGLKFKGVSADDDALIQRFQPMFRPVIQQAHDKAIETGASELTAEHMIWSMINTLDEAANWQYPNTRQSKSIFQEKQQLAAHLAEALMPNSHLHPVTVAAKFKPLADDLQKRMTPSLVTPSSTITIEPTLREVMSNVMDLIVHQHQRVPYLTGQILRANPPEGHAFYSLAQQVKQLTEGRKKPAQTRPSSSSIGSESDVGSTGSSLSNLGDVLHAKSPVLEKWVKAASDKEPPHFYDDFKPAPLSAIVTKGVEMAVQECKSQRGGRGGGQTNQNKNLASLQAFIPDTQLKHVSREHMSRVLNTALKKLQALPLPEHADALQKASDDTRQVFGDFLTDHDRSDFSLGAFVDYLKDNAETVDGLSEDHREVGNILSALVEDIQDKRLDYMEQFEKACPTVREHSINLVRQGMNGQLPQVLMRQEATDRMLDMIKSGGDQTSLLLNAASGEGKTFAVQHLAQRIADNDVPKNVQGAQLIQLDLASLIAGTGMQGDLEGRAKKIFDELNDYLNQHGNRKVLVFIDEIHMLGSDAGKVLPEIMKASGMLNRKNLTFIGATTPDDWGKTSLRKDAPFQGRFNDLALPGFTSEEKLAILGWNALKIEKESGVHIPVELVKKVLTQASAKWPENNLRHSINILRLAASLANGTPLEEAVLKDCLQHKELWLDTLKAQKTLKGPFVRQMEKTAEDAEILKAQLSSLNIGSESDGASTVKDKHVRQALAILTGERIGVMTQDELTKLRHAKEIMSQYIVGQPDALSTIAEALQEIAVRQKTGGVRKRPIASLLLPGPTGVGKTEAANVIAQEFMSNKLIRLDMSDYGEPHQISRLMGAPPGYIGYDDGGLLDQIRKQPQSVVLFDEIEKAHPDIFNVLLPILEEGKVRDNQGQPVDFSNAIVVLTSNLNNQAIGNLIREHRKKQASGNGQTDPQLAARELETQVRQLLTANASEGRAGFKPEHLGRIDYVIPFSPLTQSNVSDILKIRLQQMNQEPYLRDNNLEVQLTPAAHNRLISLTASRSSHTEGDTEVMRDSEELPLQSGARDVRNNFERFISKMVFTELTYNETLTDLENARLIVDYEPASQSFRLRTEPLPGIKKEAPTVTFDESGEEAGAAKTGASKTASARGGRKRNQFSVYA